MNTRIYNARILTMETGVEIFKGEIRIKGNRIAYVGNEDPRSAAEEIWDEEIDAEENLLMPGFKNAHTHSAMTFLRSYADDMPLSDWLTKQIFPMEAKLTPDDIYHLTKLAILEYLTSGITASFDMYLTPDTIAKAARDCGFRMVMTGGMNNFSQSIEELEEWYLKHNEPGDLVSFQLGFHAEYTNSLANLEAVAKLADKYQAPVYTHNSETENEVKGCIDRYGVTPTALFHRLGIYAYGGGGYHCVHFTEEDMDIFAKDHVSVVTNPASNMKLASGIAPISAMLKKGLNIAIGTDGPASNNCLDMFREMFLTTGLAKLREKDASAVPADEVLKMATVGGAKAMILPDCDTLSAGKCADLIMIDLRQPNMRPINNITKNIVYSGSKSNVKMTIINGRILYRDGKFSVGTDPEEIYAKANAIISRTR